MNKILIRSTLLKASEEIPRVKCFTNQRFYHSKLVEYNRNIEHNGSSMADIEGQTLGVQLIGNIMNSYYLLVSLWSFIVLLHQVLSSLKQGSQEDPCSKVFIRIRYTSISKFLRL